MKALVTRHSFGRQTFLALAALTVPLWACGGAIEDDDGVARVEEPLYVATAQLWSNPVVPVCWETSGDATEKGWVRAAILRTWERETGITFTGWGTCNGSTTHGIRIQVADVWPSTSGLGSTLDNRVNGMRLNFVFTFTQPDGTQPFGACAPASQRQGCIESIAVHEFGHALGFAHEQNRPDTPSTCTEAPQGTNGTATYGAWDAMSVMNYCNPIWNNGGALSKTDIAGAVRYYGAPRDTLVTNPASNRCLDVDSYGTENGSSIHLWDCHGASNQRWTLDAQGQLVGSGSGRCLDVSAYGTANGTPVQLWDCNATTNQRWTITARGELRGVGSGKCLDLAGYGTTNGTRLQIWDCNGTQNQLWTRPATLLKGLGSQRCLDVVGFGTANGSPLQLWDCHGGSNQQWTYTASGLVVGLGSGRCLDVVNYGVANGSALQLWDCNGTSNQRWSLTSEGVLRNVGSGRCLDVSSFGTANGSKLQLWDCNATDNQIWRTH